MNDFINMKSLIVLPFLLILVGSCYTVIDEDIGSVNNYIVSATLTDIDTLHTVHISQLDEMGEQSSVTDATVFIEDDQGSVYSFNYFVNGSYVYQGFFPIDSKYKLTIELEGDIIRSDWQSFASGGEMDSLAFGLSELLFVDDGGQQQSIEQVEFFLNFKTSEKYYALLDYQGIYEIISIPVEGRTEPPPICWITELSFNYLNPLIIQPKGPATVLRTDRLDTKFRKYNLFVEQYVINEQSFLYWDKQNRLRLLAGNIFDPIPFSSDGNLLSERNEQAVLGYFSLARYTRKQYVFGLNDLPFDPGFSNCELDFIADGSATSVCRDCRLLEFSADKPPLNWVEPD